MRRKHHEEHVNHEAWVIPYADLLTLLLALFVVLYAMSSVNTTKYRALAQAISEAFNGSRQVIRPNPQSSMAIPAGAPTPTPILSMAPTAPSARLPLPIPTHPMAPPAKDSSPATTQSRPHNEQQDLERIRSQVERALQPLIDKKMVIVRRTPNWLEIEIRTDILFPSGVAALSPSANKVLSDIGQILAPFANPLRVEGYTDDVPINTALYPSNWELSAARAASVARLFADHGVVPERLGIVGWGQYHPAGDNLSQDGRNRNRRVLIVVLSDRAAPTRFYSNSDQVNHVADADADDITADKSAPTTAALAPRPTLPSSSASAAAPNAPMQLSRAESNPPPSNAAQAALATEVPSIPAAIAINALGTIKPAQTDVAFPVISAPVISAPVMSGSRQ